MRRIEPCTFTDRSPRWGVRGATLVLLLTPLLVLTSLCARAQAGSFRIFNQGAAASGQAAAFTAQADDPSAVYYNPAGMTQLRGLQFYGGGLLAGGHTTVTSATGATTRGGFGNSIANPPPLNAYITANLGDLGVRSLRRMTVGVGLTSPFGLVYEYPRTAPFATAVTREVLPLIDIKPTIAYQVTDDLALGLGADIYTFTGLAGPGQFVQQATSSGGGILPPAGTQLEFNGKDTAAGFNVSLLYTALRNADGKPIANIGFVYRSQATLHLAGSFLANGTTVTSARATAVLPQVFTGGIAIWPIRNQRHEWKLETDVDYTGWKSFRSTDLQLGNGSTIPFPQNWRSGYTIHLGTEWKWLEVPALPSWQVAVRGGYWHSQAAIPDTSFNPAIPDADQHLIVFGLGFLCQKDGRFLGLIPCGASGRLAPQAIGLDLAYQAILYETRTVTGSTNPIAIPGTIDGTYQTVFHVGAVNLRINF
ncbi:OmpP1/FadL family transporter [Candidatus Nitrospira bockiana]